MRGGGGGNVKRGEKGKSAGREVVAGGERIEGGGGWGEWGDEKDGGRR